MGLASIVVIAITYAIGWRPFLGPRSRSLTARKFEASPERLARGRYLANGVTGSMHCHSEHDWKALGGPSIEAKLGAGQVFPESDLPGVVTAPNLAPDPEMGAGPWSDDQFARAVCEAIGHDESTWFPLMPYEQYRAMSDEDLASSRRLYTTATPIRSSLPKTELIFPVKYLVRNAPQPLTAPVLPPDLSSPVKRGEYLVRMAGCATCHTPQQRGNPMQPWGSPAASRLTALCPPLPAPTSLRILPVFRITTRTLSRGDANRKTPGSRPQRGYADRRLSKYDR
jgi:hypothetical protein